MNLEFKGLINKDDLEKDINQLDQIIDENEYAIIIENGVGKYVVFDIEYATKNLQLSNAQTSSSRRDKSPYTLVEAMIQTLEELPEKKTTAIKLSSLVDKYYGKKVSPVIIRTRAEENANDVNEINFFIIEPNNYIGLAEGFNYTKYMRFKMIRAIEYKLNTVFGNEKAIELNHALDIAEKILSSPKFSKYTSDYTRKEFKKIIIETNKYYLDNNYLVLK